MLLILGARLYIHYTNKESYQPGDTLNSSFIIWDEPQYIGRIQKIRHDGVALVLPEFPKYEYGQRIDVTGQIEENTFTSRKGEEVTELVIEYPKVELLSTPLYLKPAVWSRTRIISSVSKVLPQDEAALLVGVTLGVRNLFSRELLDVFTQTGILHIIAASGSNVAIVAGVLIFSLERLLIRRLAILITIFAIFWYALLAGFDPSIVRASCMAVIVFTAQLLGRQKMSYLVLLLTAWVMIMVSPDIWKQVGFVLSVTSTIGILVLKPYLDKLLNFTGIIKDSLNTTLAAQWGSLPIIISTFGNFAPLSILVNIAVLWIVPIIMVLGLIATLGALIHPSLSVPFTYAAYPFLFLFLRVVQISSPFIKTFEVLSFSTFITVSYYLVSISFILWLRLKYAQR